MSYAGVRTPTGSARSGRAIIAEMDEDVEHQPVVDNGAGDCICLAAMEGQMRFNNLHRPHAAADLRDLTHAAGGPVSLALTARPLARHGGRLARRREVGWDPAGSIPIWSVLVGGAAVRLPWRSRRFRRLGGRCSSDRLVLAAHRRALVVPARPTHPAAHAPRRRGPALCAKLQQEWGQRWKRPPVGVFLQIQAAAALLLAATIFLAARNPAPGLRWSDVAGIAVLLAAVIGEGLADAQLARFRGDPANGGKVCDVGLWGLSRHPNYFFQWLGWTGYAVIAIGPAGTWAWGWAALAGPAFMYWLLVHVSGIPPLEAHMLRSRGVAFAAYAKRVNAFWPGFNTKERPL
jgi:protein-S-isoprenylcysteine O-methyltransferase Ste14